MTSTISTYLVIAHNMNTIYICNKQIILLNTILIYLFFILNIIIIQANTVFILFTTYNTILEHRN